MEIVIESPLSEPKSQLLASVTSKNAASTTTKMRRKEVTRAILSIEGTELASWEKFMNKRWGVAGAALFQGR